MICRTASIKRPRDIADQSRNQRDRRKLEGDGFIRETFTLPIAQARPKARQILDAYPAGGYMTIVENWRQLPDGQIQFTMRRRIESRGDGYADYVDIGNS